MPFPAMLAPQGSYQNPAVTGSLFGATGRRVKPPAEARLAAGNVGSPGTRPVRCWHPSTTAEAKESASSAMTRLTVQPAQPAPESLPPRKPGEDSADAIRASRAGELFSKSSRLDACEADI